MHPHDRPVRLPEVLAGDMSHLSVSDATSRLLVTLWQGDSDNLHELIVERVRFNATNEIIHCKNF